MLFKQKVRGEEGLKLKVETKGEERKNYDLDNHDEVVREKCCKSENSRRKDAVKKSRVEKKAFFKENFNVTFLLTIL